ncbi:MAG: LamG domain-containing protein [Candidatus Micrarchaeota archaeon]|nr:LamG domain-containing protein [Candidatus Micrarchaeota archaeon]
MRSQSAMEYLMTYGWAILAIAIVMVSLYSLGIFNTGNLTPTATPGSCQVIRTPAQTGLAGQCGNLIPKYVGQFNWARSSEVKLGSYPGYTSLTRSVWFYLSGPTTTHQFAIGSAGNGCCNYRIGILSGGTRLAIDPGNSNDQYSASNVLAYKQWYNVVVTAQNNGSSITYAVYLNGTQITMGTGSTSGSIQSISEFCIGSGNSCGSEYFNGSIANVQIYNTSLDSGSVESLYQEGIGGAPIDLQHLVAWYPLNGNTNDYSGNNHNPDSGNVVNLNWNANWQSGYSNPS